MRRSLAGIGICYTFGSSAESCAANSATARIAFPLAIRAMDRDRSPRAKSPQAPSTPLETPMQDRPTKTTPDLFTPIDIGPLALPNRIAMAPLTRSRAPEGNVPTSLNALYYAQRASAGLIIAEATQVSAGGPGLYLDAWHPQRRTDQRLAMRHRRGACLGRPHRAPALACRPHLASILPAGGKLPVAPSAIRPNGQAFTAKGFEPIPAHALSSSPRFPASSRNTRKERGTRWKQASTASRYMARTAI